jgi:GntR family transcriptional regulator/MocR family aminotransferase
MPLGSRLAAYAGSQATRVHAALRDAILNGELVSDTQLPPTRSLAQWLGVARHAVVSAYESLQGDGLLVARVGSGSFVAPGLTPHKRTAPTPLRPLVLPDAHTLKPFALGVPVADSAFQQRLAGAVRHHMLSLDTGTLGYGDPRGSAALREVIARELAMTRGVPCTAEQIVITAGTQQVLRLCTQALMKPGDIVWMEDPGYLPARRTLVAAGLQPRAAAVDSEGIAALATPEGLGPAKAVYVTPSHQFPTGIVMSLSRRLALLEWARSNQAWILEDDYDSDFRYRGAPVTALAGLDQIERVIYIGTFSKSAFPALRLAYAVLPEAALPAVLAARSTFDRFAPTMLELAVADLMRDGSLAQHLRRARQQCRKARDLLVRVLESRCRGQLTITAPEQGTHLLAWLPPGIDANAGRKIREVSGLSFTLLSETRFESASKQREALVLGFAGFSIDEIQNAADRLGDAVSAQLAKSRTARG